jgi:hypothetical protein
MQSHTSFPAENVCTCGYLTYQPDGLFDRRSYDLTRPIGALLIALGNAFANVPVFQLYISSGTAKLLLSIGRKLLRSVEPSSGMDC